MTQAPAPMYTRAAGRAARTVIGRYSTSFSLASRLLPSPVSERIGHLYAMVRVADEVVDGAWPNATGAQKIAELEAFRARIVRAVDCGFSSDLIVHAFAQTARATGITAELWDPFFASMAADADPEPPTPDPRPADIHGSAEVVGLMCLRIFLADTPVPPARLTRLEDGARALGSAFQRVNFLRDLAEDADELHRAYLCACPETGETPPDTGASSRFGGMNATGMNAEAKDREVAVIRADLDRAAAVIDELPAPVRPAVWAAHDLFAELTERLDAAPAELLATSRIRVPDAKKLAIVAGAVYRGATSRSGPAGSPTRTLLERALLPHAPRSLRRKNRQQADQARADQHRTGPHDEDRHA